MITEKELIEKLKNAKNALLIEPPYRIKYIPLGLAKISSFIKANGGHVTYARDAIPNKPGNPFDLICITSVFTTDMKHVLRVIRNCQQSLFLRNTEIIIGGIAATLMSDFIYKKTKVKSFCGYSKILDQTIPDYSMDWFLTNPIAKKTWYKYSTVFTSRGCPNNCGYCAVGKLEPDHWINPEWKKCIVDEKENVKISDNNLLSTPEEHHLKVLDHLGKIQKGVLFNNGIYAGKINNKNAALLAKLKYVSFGLRTAFDRIEEDGIIQKGLEKLIQAGVKPKGKTLIYVLFNFNDTPQDAYYRVKESWKYGFHPYAMQYRPLKELEKGKFVGKHWTYNLIRAFKNYVELYGYNRGDRTFESWQKSEHAKIQLIDIDWDKWYYKK